MNPFKSPTANAVWAMTAAIRIDLDGDDCSPFGMRF